MSKFPLSDKQVVLNDDFPFALSGKAAASLRKLTVKELIELAAEIRSFGVSEYRRGRADFESDAIFSGRKLSEDG